MRLRAGLCRVSAGAVWTLAPLLAAAAHAGIGVDHHRISGRASLETRWFPETAVHAGQSGHASGFVAAPRLYLEDTGGRSLTLAPFLRYDSTDPRRTHADLREAYLLLFGEIGDGEWELRAGVARVFWGVAESQHLVDIVNQVDLVEHPAGKAKLGQPMVHLTWSANWGALEFFGLPLHRARTFPGESGRLRLPLLVDDESVEYESDAGGRHLDLAARYSHSFRSLDFGLSCFRGTSREPFLMPGTDPEGPGLVQYYAQIRQFGIDAQLTAGSWLFKLEGIHRAGARNLSGREKDFLASVLGGEYTTYSVLGSAADLSLIENLSGGEEDYFASVLGGEYTTYSVLGSAADLSLLGEWSYDGRGRNATPSRSPNTLENDLFFASRLALNDVQSTEIVASILGDAERATRAMAVEFERRLSDRWSLQLETIYLLSNDKEDLFNYWTRRDSFAGLGLTCNF